MTCGLTHEWQIHLKLHYTLYYIDKEEEEGEEEVGQICSWTDNNCLVAIINFNLTRKKDCCKSSRMDE